MTLKKGVSLNIIYFLIYAFLTGLSIVLPKNAVAQTDSVKAKQLKDVEINQYKKSNVNQSPVPVQILEGAELQRLNSLSVADAVRFFSGVQLKDYGGIGGLKTINVRSMGSNHTAVFYDGIQLGNAQNGQVDLGKYSLDNMEEISVYVGQKPDLLIPARGYAAASALYLKTATPKFVDGKSYQANVSMKAGSFGLLNPSINYKQKINNKLSLSFDGAYVEANGKYKFRYKDYEYDTTVVRNNGDVKSLRLEATLFGTLADSSQWNVKVYNYNSARGLPGAIVSNKYTFTQRQWDDNTFVQGSYHNNLAQKYNLLLNAKYAYSFLRYIDPEIKLNKGILDNRFTEQECYLSATNLYKFSKLWQVSLATDYSLQKLDANLYNFAYPTRQTGLIALASGINLKKLQVQGNVLATLVHENVEQGIAAGNKQEFTPTIMASWQPFDSPDFRLRSFYKSIFRLPTFNDLYYTFVGNSNLRPEYIHQYDIGFTFNKAPLKKRLAYFSIHTDAYYNRVKDKIVAIPGNNLGRWTIFNIGDVSIKGVETNIQTVWSLAKDLSLKASANYTFEKAIDISATAFNYGDQVPYIPVNSGTARLAIDYKNFSFNYGYIYTGERYSQSANIPVNYVKPWYTHDLTVGTNFKLNTTRLALTAEVNNVFNQYYDVVLNYPMPGRNYRFTLKSNF
ncbi:vitamin B12 transporter [Pedobacter sp. UYP30]|uniref:TonB-dependent receptor plug domain-containing protein n=1 Tax=Pedobacter sp. UYP30 TaxID=1756400 RepID=UPI00339740BA